MPDMLQEQQGGQGGQDGVGMRGRKPEDEAGEL